MLDFIFDYRSPYAYLANTRLPTLPAPANYRGVDVVEVMRLVNNQPSPKCPAKARYSVLDAERWAAHYQVPWGPNKALLAAMGRGTFDGVRLCRAGLAARQLGVFTVAHEALFAAVWASNDDLLNELGRLSFLHRHGIDADIWAAAEQPEIREQLDSNTAYAAAHGVFGVPSFLVGDELFFGNDRLEFVRSALARHAGG